MGALGRYYLGGAHDEGAGGPDPPSVQHRFEQQELLEGLGGFAPQIALGLLQHVVGNVQLHLAAQACTQEVAGGAGR
jgi:hypothetical protein